MIDSTIVASMFLLGLGVGAIFGWWLQAYALIIVSPSFPLRLRSSEVRMTDWFKLLKRYQIRRLDKTIRSSSDWQAQSSSPWRNHSNNSTASFRKSRSNGLALTLA